MTKRPRKSKRGPAYLKNKVSFFIGGAPYIAKVKPAKTAEEFPRELKHCELGEEGECASCANAQAGMDAGVAPFMVFIDSRAVGIDKWVRISRGKNSAYMGVGRIWEHGQSWFQKKYDMNKEALLASPDAVGTVRLRPYRTNKPGSGPKKKRQLTDSPRGVRPMPDHRSRKGALRRAQRAGIFFVKK